MIKYALVLALLSVGSFAKAESQEVEVYSCIALVGTIADGRTVLLPIDGSESKAQQLERAIVTYEKILSQDPITRAQFAKGYTGKNTKCIQYAK